MTDPCERALDLLGGARPDGAGPEPDGWLADHLESCPSCRLYARTLAAFDARPPDDLEAAVPAVLVADASTRLQAALRTAGRDRSRSVHRPWPRVLAAALALMMLLSGWLVLENRRLRAEAVVAAAPAPRAFPATERTLTAGDLVARLRALPPRTPVLSAEELAVLLRRDRPLLHALIRGPRLASVLADGLTAGQAVALLDRLDPDTPITAVHRTGGRS